MNQFSIPHPLVLVIDDDPTLHLWANRHLYRAGFRLVSALTGKEGITAFKETSPDIVLLDYEMPIMDGLATCEELRKLVHCQDTPILMITGSQDPIKIEASYQSGATDFVVKPINWRVLIQRLRYMIKASTTLHKLEKSELRLSKAQKMARLGYWEWNPYDDTLYWSEEIYEIFQKDIEIFDLNQQNFLNLIHAEDLAYVEKSFNKVLKSGVMQTIEYRIKSHDERQRFIKQQIEIMHNRADEPLGLSGTIQDVTEYKEHEIQVKHLAYYDEITQLPNRTCFLELLAKSLEIAQRYNRNIAVLFLDLDGFKGVNDTYGHHTGDQLLREIAIRIKEGLRHSDVASRYVPAMDYHVDIARMGGDEFIILVNELTKPEDAAIVAQHIHNWLEEPIAIDDLKIYTAASIGIAVYPQDGLNGETLLKNADIAMYYAKNMGKGHYQFFHDFMNVKAKKRQTMDTAMHQAVRNHELILMYQPVVNAMNGNVLGVEALMRWQHPSLGFLPPSEFITLAEENGLIVQLGEWAFREACRQHKQWLAQGLGHLTIALNLSGVQFNQPGFIAMVKAILSEYQVAPVFLVFEITESMLMADTDKVLKTLMDIKDLGIKLSIDDFGTGYSSLSYLKRFPLDFLKIDRSFIKDLPTNKDDRAIVQAIMALASALDLQTIAEGVETSQQREFLEMNSCDFIQGFLFGKPMSVDELQAGWFSRSTANFSHS